jgi:hypothetical protein
VIGGVAAILHGVPRMTADIDLLIESTVDNAQRMLAVLKDLGYATADLVEAQGLTPVKLLMFENGIKIDVMLQIPGLHFATAWKNKLTMHINEQSFYILAKADLISAKLAAARQRDLEDVAVLQAIESYDKTRSA